MSRKRQLTSPVQGSSKLQRRAASLQDATLNLGKRLSLEHTIDVVGRASEFLQHRPNTLRVLKQAHAIPHQPAGGDSRVKNTALVKGLSDVLDMLTKMPSSSDQGAVEALTFEDLQFMDTIITDLQLEQQKNEYTAAMFQHLVQGGTGVPPAQPPALAPSQGGTIVDLASAVFNMFESRQKLAHLLLAAQAFQAGIDPATGDSPIREALQQLDGLMAMGAKINARTDVRDVQALRKLVAATRKKIAQMPVEAQTSSGNVLTLLERSIDATQQLAKQRAQHTKELQQAEKLFQRNQRRARVNDGFLTWTKWLTKVAATLVAGGAGATALRKYPSISFMKVVLENYLLGLDGYIAKWITLLNQMQRDEGKEDEEPDPFFDDDDFKGDDDDDDPGGGGGGAGGDLEAGGGCLENLARNPAQALQQQPFMFTVVPPRDNPAATVRLAVDRGRAQALQEWAQSRWIDVPGIFGGPNRTTRTWALAALRMLQGDIYARTVAVFTQESRDWFESRGVDPVQLDEVVQALIRTIQQTHNQTSGQRGEQLRLAQRLSRMKQAQDETQLEFARRQQLAITQTLDRLDLVNWPRRAAYPSFLEFFRTLHHHSVTEIRLDDDRIVPLVSAPEDTPLVKRLTQQQERLQGTIQQLRAQMEASQAKLRDQQRAHERKSDSLRETHGRTLRALQDDQIAKERELARVRADLKKSQKDNKKIQQLEKDKLKLQAKITDLRAARDKLEREFRTETEKQKDSNRKQEERERRQHNQELQRLEGQLAALRQQLIEAREQATADVDKQRELNRQQQDRARTEHTKEVTRLQKQLEALRKELQKAEEKAKADAMEQSEQTFRKELRASKKHNKEKEALKTKVDKLQTKLAETKAKADAASQKGVAAGVEDEKSGKQEVQEEGEEGPSEMQDIPANRKRLGSAPKVTPAKKKKRIDPEPSQLDINAYAWTPQVVQTVESIRHHHREIRRVARHSLSQDEEEEKDPRDLFPIRAEATGADQLPFDRDPPPPPGGAATVVSARDNEEQLQWNFMFMPMGFYRSLLMTWLEDLLPRLVHVPATPRFPSRALQASDLDHLVYSEQRAHDLARQDPQKMKVLMLTGLTRHGYITPTTAHRLNQYQTAYAMTKLDDIHRASKRKHHQMFRAQLQHTVYQLVTLVGHRPPHVMASSLLHVLTRTLQEPHTGRVDSRRDVPQPQLKYEYAYRAAGMTNPTTHFSTPDDHRLQLRQGPSKNDVVAFHDVAQEQTVTPTDDEPDAIHSTVNTPIQPPVEESTLYDYFADTSVSLGKWIFHGFSTLAPALTQSRRRRLYASTSGRRGRT